MSSEGVGKSSLGEKILKPLVGELNTSTPDESAIVDSAFNSWAAHKRLAVVHEIYAGHSAKAYNRLKSVIADETITINQKYQVPYDLENWVHVFACSNSMKAIKLEDEDRRWFVPGVTEEKKDGAFWERLNYWLTDDGGIPKLKWWAKAFCEEHSPVPERDISPLSVAKQLMIEESRSPGQKLILDTIETIKNRYENTPVFFLDTDGVELIKHKIYAGKAPSWLETPLTVRATAKRKGMFAGPRRINFGGIGRGFVVATTQAHANMSPETLLSNNIKQLKINDLLEF